MAGVAAKFGDIRSDAVPEQVKFGWAGSLPSFGLDAATIR